MNHQQNVLTIRSAKGKAQMATFKVGQRVRVVAVDRRGTPADATLGREGVIVKREPSTSPYHWQVAVDGVPSWIQGETGNWAFRESQLAPLTDPKADEFIERIKRLEREPMPLVKETA